MSARMFRISLPMPVNRANSRRHWRTVLRHKKRYFADCDERQLLGMIPRPPVTPFARCVLAVTMYLGQHMDDDNAMSRLKEPVDWLKTRGYIANDSRKVVTWSGFPRQVIERGNPYRVEMVLTELTEKLACSTLQEAL